MPEQVADVCDRCGRVVVKKRAEDSSGMVQFLGTEDSLSACMLLLVDPLSKSTRPTFALVGKRWCPECLIKDLQEWFEKAR